jgi:catechol 2,3-dioxygenase-like lactoylglutathione lyase family enzyme
MLDHTGFPVSDYAQSKAFYLQALAPLGYALIMEVQQHENDHPAAGFGANGKPDLWIGGEGGLQRPIHIAIAAQDRAHRDCGRITIRTITRPSCSILTATISRPCVTRRRETRVTRS